MTRNIKLKQVSVEIFLSRFSWYGKLPVNLSVRFKYGKLRTRATRCLRLFFTKFAYLLHYISGKIGIKASYHNNYFYLKSSLLDEFMASTVLLKNQQQRKKCSEKVYCLFLFLRKNHLFSCFCKVHHTSADLAVPKMFLSAIETSDVVVYFLSFNAV